MRQKILGATAWVNRSNTARNSMGGFLAFFLLLGISSVHAGEVSVDIRCFSDSNRRINLELMTYSDSEIGLVGGQVRYRQSKEFIPLAYKGSVILREDKERPWLLNHTWLEIFDGAITGQYELRSQGAVTDRLTYTNKRTGKTVDISNQTYTDNEGKCTWD